MYIISWDWGFNTCYAHEVFECLCWLCEAETGMLKCGFGSLWLRWELSDCYDLCPYLKCLPESDLLGKCFSNAGCLNQFAVLFVRVFQFWWCWMLWILQLLFLPKQPDYLVPKPVMVSAALRTAAERKLLLCGKERSTGRIIARWFFGCKLMLSPS